MATKYLIILLIIPAVLAIVALVFLIKYIRNNYNTMMKKAREIDPNVKTMAEANYVLTKDIAKSVGTGHKDGKVEKKENDNEKS